MELANLNLIDELLRSARPQRRWSRKPAAEPPAAGKRRYRRRICQCGTCPTCVDNARWERIFQQKFADPSYYSARIPTPGSSLHLG